MMDWRDKMRLGVELIHEACEQDMQSKNCHDCPFDKICDIIVEAYNTNPSRFNTSKTWKTWYT